MTEHLGHAKHEPPEGGAGQHPQRHAGKTVLTDAAGEVDIEVPRDRAGTFEPVIVRSASGACPMWTRSRTRCTPRA